jgi:proliferating cell nuclear antigen
MSESAPGTKDETTEALSAIIRADVLQQVLDQLQTVASEAILRIGHDGLQVAAVDPGKVAIVDIDLDAAAFESVGDGKFPIGVNLNSLDDYLGNASGGDLVQLAYQEESRFLNVQHTNVDVDMAAIDPGAIRDGPSMPDVETTAEVALEGSLLKDGVKNANLVSDHVHVIADPDDKEFRLTGEGDMDTIETAFGREELTDAHFEKGADSLYSLQYLIASANGVGGVLLPAPDNAIVHAVFGDDLPITFTYEFADGHGEATLSIAPRILRE